MGLLTLSLPKLQPYIAFSKQEYKIKSPLNMSPKGHKKDIFIHNSERVIIIDSFINMSVFPAAALV